MVSKKFFFTSAESCTGGWLGQSVTSVQGSSFWFSYGFITYSNTSKINLLKVSKNTLEKFGAVSEEVVEEMVVGALKKSGADIGVAISGIAGPDGGTKEKPIGTVWIGYSDKDKTTSKKLILTKRRNINITLSAVNALNQIRINLESNSKSDSNSSK